MARGKKDTPATDNNDTGQPGSEATGGAPAPARPSRKKRETKGARITLTLDEDTVYRLNCMALKKRSKPHKIVEDLLRPIVSTYFVSNRGSGESSENETAA